MSSSRGKFVWYELMTTDMRAAEAFYTKVVGWSIQASGMPGMDYTMFTDGKVHVAGLMTLPPGSKEAGLKPGWVGYVAVDDVDAATADAAKAGGIICRPAEDIPGVGRFSMVAPQQGGMIALFKSADSTQESPASVTAPAHVGWHEFHAKDYEAAWKFYSGLTGWTKGETMDMGPGGTYQMFPAGQAFGAVYNSTQATDGPFWLYYFNVGGINAAAARVKEAGGKVLNGPHEVPGGGWIVQCVDPQSAMFALVGTKD